MFSFFERKCDIVEIANEQLPTNTKANETIKSIKCRLCY